MQKPAKVRINIQDYRAISHADITINGITVVAGENGCGKSTLSKILYYIFKISSSYDFLVGENLFERLGNVIRFLEIAIRDGFVVDRSLRNDMLKDYRILVERLQSEVPSEELLVQVLYLLDRVTLITKLRENDKENHNFKRRLAYIASDLLEIKSIENEQYLIPFDKIKLKIEDAFKNAFGLIKSRGNFLVKEELVNVFHTSKLPEKLEVYEVDELLLSLSKNHISIPYGIQNTIYIDTPMMLGEYSSDNQHWNDLNNILSSNKYNKKYQAITSIISNEILKGDVKYDDDLLASSMFSFSRIEDGKVFNLMDCATGIKSFSILQMLLKLGHIDDKTLLIFDEPESNLHPQWIVEYARIIVLIHKNVGAKFFIASHNPDLISAIRYISERQDVLDNTNFYLAVKEGTGYDYKFLNKEIDPIFSSFNIALDRIEKYGI